MARRKNAAAVALAKQRTKSLSPERRAEIARTAAQAKWAKLTTTEERQKAVENANKARRKSKPEKG